MKILPHITLLLLLLPSVAGAQQLDYTSYINRVMQGNLDYAAARLDLSVSQADLAEARKIADPSITAEYGNWDIAMGLSISF